MLLISYILIICLVLLGLFFFFKQKTAYDMRISDWSSDVCSSDLFELRLFGNMRVDGAISAHPSASEPGRESVGERVRRRLAHRAADRKSVVEGKSVSVRVDLGGRSILNKKKKTP